MAQRVYIHVYNNANNTIVIDTAVLLMCWVYLYLYCTVLYCSQQPQPYRHHICYCIDCMYSTSRKIIVGWGVVQRELQMEALWFMEPSYCTLWWRKARRLTRCKGIYIFLWLFEFLTLTIWFSRRGDATADMMKSTRILNVSRPRLSAGISHYQSPLSPSTMGNTPYTSLLYP